MQWSDEWILQPDDKGAVGFLGLSMSWLDDIRACNFVKENISYFNTQGNRMKFYVTKNQKVTSWLDLINLFEKICNLLISCESNNHIEFHAIALF